MADRRNERTCEAIKEALLQLLKHQRLDEISVTALAKQAKVSRSTFYSHFENVYTVYELLVKDFLSTVSLMESQLKCSQCAEHPSDKLPYCMAVRTTEKYSGVVRDRQYVSTMLEMFKSDPFAEQVLLPYLKLNIDRHGARMLLSFQMAGCHMVATSEYADTQWPQKKLLLDTFIAGGMSAVSSIAERRFR